MSATLSSSSPSESDLDGDLDGDAWRDEAALESKPEYLSNPPYVSVYSAVRCIGV